MSHLSGPRSLPPGMPLCLLLGGYPAQGAWGVASVALGVALVFRGDPPNATWLAALPEVSLAVAGVAAALGLYRVVTGLKELRLLRDGTLTWGRFEHIEQELQRRRSNAEPRWRVSYRTREGTQEELTVRTTDPERLTSDQRQALVYDPARPQRVVLLRMLPMTPAADEEGQISQALSGRVAPLFAGLPALTVALSLFLLLKLLTD